MRSGSGYRTCSFRTILPLLIVLITAALGVIIPSSPTWKTSLRVLNAIPARRLPDPFICVVSGVGATPTRRHWTAFANRRHLGPCFFARNAAKIGVPSARHPFRQPGLSLLRHHMAEAGVVRSKFPVVRIVSPDIRTLARSRPLRPLFGRVLPHIERILFTESAGHLASSRPNARRPPHLRSPFHARRPESAGRQVQQRLPLEPQQSYPGDFGLSELIEFVRPVQVVHNHVVAILLTQPVVERCFPPSRSLFPVLPKPCLR